jgi:hypothetical protein
VEQTSEDPVVEPSTTDENPEQSTNSERDSRLPEPRNYAPEKGQEAYEATVREADATAIALLDGADFEPGTGDEQATEITDIWIFPKDEPGGYEIWSIRKGDNQESAIRKDLGL